MLLSIDLDRHEVFIEQRRRRVILKGFPLHHVTPVAGAVADGKKDRHVASSGLAEGGLTPRLPRNGVVRVLLQVRRRFLGQLVGVLRHSASI